MGSAVTGPFRFGPRLAALAVLMLVCAVPAWANQPPGPQMFLAEILILPLMMLFTALGGGYGVMRAKGEKPRRFYKYLAVVAIFLTGMHEGFAAILMIVFGMVALGRAVQLMVWGLGALRAPEERRPHLAQAVPLRLISGGLLTLVAAVGLTGLSFAFIGWWPSEYYVEREFKLVVAYQLARGKEHKDANGNPQFGAPRPVEPGQVAGAEEFENQNLGLLRRGGYGYFQADFRVGPEARSFQAWLWPRRMPFFPYNYLVTLPSFYADETGQMRMIRVHHVGQRCPPSAPVYYRSRPEDLQSR